MTRLTVRLAVALARDVRAQLPGLPTIVNPRPAWVRAQARAMGAHTDHRTDLTDTLTAPATPRGDQR